MGANGNGFQKGQKPPPNMRSRKYNQKNHFTKAMWNKWMKDFNVRQEITGRVELFRGMIEAKNPTPKV